jgi:hypothetical protein
MSRNQTNNDRHEERTSGSEFVGTPCCTEGVDFSGGCGNMGQMMKASPCAGWLGRHRLAVYTAMTAVGLGILILQAGWVLGIIAFFRTF